METIFSGLLAIGLYLLAFGLAIGLIALCLGWLTKKIPFFRPIFAVIVGFASYAAWEYWWLSLIIAFLVFGLVCMWTETKTSWGGKVHCSKCGFDVLDILEDDGIKCKTKCPRCGHETTWMQG